MTLRPLRPTAAAGAAARTETRADADQGWDRKPVPRYHLDALPLFAAGTSGLWAHPRPGPDVVVTVPPQPGSIDTLKPDQRLRISPRDHHVHVCAERGDHYPNDAFWLDFELLAVADTDDPRAAEMLAFWAAYGRGENDLIRSWESLYRQFEQGAYDPLNGINPLRPFRQEIGRPGTAFWMARKTRPAMVLGQIAPTAAHGVFMTSEGPSAVEPGWWVLRHPVSNRVWVVRHDRFTRRYELRPADQ